MSENCPHCNADLTSGPYFRTIGIEVQGEYDGVLFYMCPDCNGRWHRWPEGSRLHDKAKQYVEAP